MTSKQNSLRRRRHREVLLANDDHCHYCGTQLDERTATLDHVRPLSKGGPNARTNPVLSCRECNVRKGNAAYESMVR